MKLKQKITDWIKEDTRRFIYIVGWGSWGIALIITIILDGSMGL